MLKKYKTNTFCGAEHWLDVFHSDFAENPSEWGGWAVIPFSSRYASSQDPSEFFVAKRIDGHVEIHPANLGIRRKLAVGLAYPLSLYSHSGDAWSIQGRGMQCRFDTSNYAGILIYKSKPKDLPPEKREKSAEDFLRIYNAYVNGEVYDVRACWYDPRNYAKTEIIPDEEISGEWYGYCELIDMLEKAAPFHRVTGRTKELFGRDRLRWLGPRDTDEDDAARIEPLDIDLDGIERF